MPPPGGIFDVRAFGARGDGQTLDTDAIHVAIAAAHAAGGGTVYFSAGTYRSVSIRLQSRITLSFGPGSGLEAAPSALYDAVLVADGADAVQHLKGDGHALEFMRDQYRHCKPICVMGAAGGLLKTAGIPLRCRMATSMLGW